MHCGSAQRPGRARAARGMLGAVVLKGGASLSPPRGACRDGAAFPCHLQGLATSCPTFVPLTPPPQKKTPSDKAALNLKINPL